MSSDRLRALGDPAQIRAYVHPVRMAILQLLAAERRTVTGVARELRVHPANITHHFKLLRRVGLIRLVETRDTGRNLEKYYAAVARSFVVRPRARGAVSRQALALGVLRDNLSAAIESLPVAATQALLVSARLGARDFARFAGRLRALASEFERADAAAGRSYSLNLGLYPDQADVVRPKSRVRIR